MALATGIGHPCKRTQELLISNYPLPENGR